MVRIVCLEFDLFLTSNSSDDALKRLVPSLSAYEGCDIIDLNPGNCLWSSKIHQALKPRWHALVEPNVKFYKPFLDKMISMAPDRFTHLPTNPYEKQFWPTFLEEHGTKMRSMETPKLESGVNRSLLVLANLGQTTRKSKAFDGPLAPFYLQNFVDAMYNKEHIHSHGFVRILAWMSNDQKGGILPRTIAGRTKLGLIFEGTVSPKDIVGRDRSSLFFWRFRRHWPIDVEGSQRLAQSTEKEQLFDPPERRQPELGPHPISVPNDPEGRKIMHKLKNKGAFFDDLLKLEDGVQNNQFRQYKESEQGKRRRVTDEWKQLTNLRGRYTVKNIQYRQVEEHVNKRLALDEEERSLATSIPYSPDSKVWAELDSKIRAWKTEGKVWNLNSTKDKVYKDVDDWRAFRTDPPVLAWDQRDIDPLLPQDDEFFPRDVMSLVDLEPKPQLINLIDTPEKPTCLRLICQLLGTSGAQTMEELLEFLTPGAGLQFAARVPSLLDANKGGSRFLYDLRSRTVPSQTLIEMAVALEKFPLRPTFTQMRSQMMNVDRTQRTREDDD